MNIASLELCKELYELSGWFDTDGYHYLTFDGEYETQFASSAKARGGWWAVSGEPAKDCTPAYDLGYLLRKLPMRINDQNHYAYLRLGKDRDGYGICYMAGDLISQFSNTADTPEYAACKLAIELFKDGTLKKEE